MGKLGMTEDGVVLSYFDEPFHIPPETLRFANTLTFPLNKLIRIDGDGRVIVFCVCRAEQDQNGGLVNIRHYISPVERLLELPIVNN